MKNPFFTFPITFLPCVNSNDRMTLIPWQQDPNNDGNVKTLIVCYKIKLSTWLTRQCVCECFFFDPFPYNHIGRTFDRCIVKSETIKSATLILQLKVGLGRPFDRSRFWRYPLPPPPCYILTNILHNIRSSHLQQRLHLQVFRTFSIHCS